MSQRIILFIMLVLGSPVLQAASVTYSTTTSQLCIGASGCGTNTQTIGGGSGVIITFNPVASATVNAAPTTTGVLGELVVSCVGGGTACGSQSLAGMNLYLNIAQTAPTAGNGSITGGVMTGSISGTVSSAVVTWSVPNTITIGSIAYSVASTPLALVAANNNFGTSAVTASITDNAYVATPVPTLSHAGLLGIILTAFVAGAWAIRRRAAGR